MSEQPNCNRCGKPMGEVGAFDPTGKCGFMHPHCADAARIEMQAAAEIRKRRIADAAPELFRECRTMLRALANLRSQANEGYTRPLSRELELAIEGMTRAIAKAEGRS